MNDLDRIELTRPTPRERLAPISDLWDSLSDNEAALPPAQVIEIERRLASFHADRRSAAAFIGEKENPTPTTVATKSGSSIN